MATALTLGLLHHRQIHSTKIIIIICSSSSRRSNVGRHHFGRACWCSHHTTWPRQHVGAYVRQIFTHTHPDTLPTVHPQRLVILFIMHRNHRHQHRPILYQPCRRHHKHHQHDRMLQPVNDDSGLGSLRFRWMNRGGVCDGGGNARPNVIFLLLVFRKWSESKIC